MTASLFMYQKIYLHISKLVCLRARWPKDRKSQNHNRCYYRCQHVLVSLKTFHTGTRRSSQLPSHRYQPQSKPELEYQRKKPRRASKRQPSGRVSSGHLRLISTALRRGGGGGGGGVHTLGLHCTVAVAEECLK